MTSSFTLLDGGLSTALEQLGNAIKTSLWTGELLRTKPDQIRAAHKLYVDAKAEILITSSYQISFKGCERFGWTSEEVIQALRNSTELARFPNVKVAASVGPYGAILANGAEYRGNYGISITELKDFHRERLQVLADTHPDYLAIETIPELTEARAIIELIQELEISIPFWISFTCKSEREISSGELFSDAVSLVANTAGAIAVGINCSPPNLISPLMRSVSKQIPYVVYPNSGRIWDSINMNWLGNANERFNESAIEEWAELGANIIGGCCTIGPNEILQMASLKNLA